MDRFPTKHGWDLLRILLVIVVIFLALFVIVPEDVRAPGQSTEGDIVDNQTLALAPETDGHIQASHEFELPDDVTSFEVRIPAGAIVQERAGFTRVDDRRYRWDGTHPSPRLDYLAAVNRQIDRDGPIAGPGDYLFKDGGDWALVGTPRPSYGWSWTGDAPLTVNRHASVDGPGEVSDRIAFLGEHDRHTHRAHGQEFVLIEPDRADLAEDPADIFDSLEHASDALRVGDRDETVFMVAAPTDETGWGVRGLQTGPADMWVRDVETLDDPNNVWLHEYVHTRQDYSTDPTARWFTEASASYYAALLTYEQGHIGFDTLRSWLERGTHERYDGVHLTDPASWNDHADYVVGPLVMGELDRQLRERSDGEVAFTDVFRRFNEQEGIVDHAAVLDYLEATGGEPIAAAGDDYLGGTTRPTTWDRSAHDRAFGVQPARFATRIEEVRVSGAYRDRALDGHGTPTLVPDETVSLVVVVENRGDVSGRYDVPFRVGETTVDRFDGRLGPGEEQTIEATHRVTDLGDIRLTVGEARQAVHVRPPADARVTDLSVEPTAVDRGAAVTVEATVVNDKPYPGRTSVGFTRGGRTVVERLATVDGQDDGTVRASIPMTRRGTVPIGVRGTDLDPISVTVEGERQLLEVLALSLGGLAIALLFVGGLYAIGRRRQPVRSSR